MRSSTTGAPGSEREGKGERAKATEAGDLGGRGGSPQEKLDPGNR